MPFYVYMLKSKSFKPITYVGYTNRFKKKNQLFIIVVKVLNSLEVENGHLFIKKNLNLKEKQFLANII